MIKSVTPNRAAFNPVLPQLGALPNSTPLRHIRAAAENPKAVIAKLERCLAKPLQSPADCHYLELCQEDQQPIAAPVDVVKAMKVLILKNEIQQANDQPVELVVKQQGIVVPLSQVLPEKDLLDLPTPGQLPSKEALPTFELDQMSSMLLKMLIKQLRFQVTDQNRAAVLGALQEVAQNLQSMKQHFSSESTFYLRQTGTEHNVLHNVTDLLT